MWASMSQGQGSRNEDGIPALEGLTLRTLRKQIHAFLVQDSQLWKRYNRDVGGNSGEFSDLIVCILSFYGSMGVLVC